MGGFEDFYAIFMEEIDNPNPDLRIRECCLLVLKNLLLDGKHSFFTWPHMSHSYLLAPQLFVEGGEENDWMSPLVDLLQNEDNSGMLLLVLQNIGIFLEQSPQTNQKFLSADDLQRLVDILGRPAPVDLKEEILWVLSSLVEEDGMLISPVLDLSIFCTNSEMHTTEEEIYKSCLCSCGVLKVLPIILSSGEESLLEYAIGLISCLAESECQTSWLLSRITNYVPLFSKYR